MSLEGKVAVVTGAASGIGLAAAKSLAAEGAQVIVADISEDKGAEAAKEITEQGNTATFIPLDVTDPDSVNAFKDEALAWKSRVDVLVHGAGWGRTEPFVENTPEFWRKVIDINFVGPIYLTRALLDDMMERKEGKIIVVASDAGRVGSLGETVYSGAKGGAIAFAKGLAREMARYNINVNVVSPGPTDTPLFAAVPDKFKEAFLRATPLRRFGKPEEVADAIVFFASDRSSYITGQVLSVNGGLAIVS